MSLTWAKISDDKDDRDAPDATYGETPQTIYFRRPLGCSPSGNYAFGHDFGGNLDRPYYVVNTSASPPALEWGHMLGLTDGFGGFDPMSVYNVDDEGSLWAGTGFADGDIYELPVDDSGPVVRYTWTQLNDDNPNGANLTIARIFTFTLSDDTIKILTMPEGTAGTDNPWMFLATKGTPGLTNISTHDSPGMAEWFPNVAFLDDNDDIWVIGTPAPHTPFSTTANFYRITDVGGSPYDDYIEVTMPIAGWFPTGYFADGKFIGTWSDTTDVMSNWYFSVDLTTGTLATRDVTANPVKGAYDSAATSFEWGPLQCVPPNPAHFFIPAYDGTTNRIVREILPDLTDGVEYSLDDWLADDGQVDDASGNLDTRTTTIYPIYLDTPRAFCSARKYWADPDPIGNWDIDHSDFYEYYFGADDSPPPEDGEAETTTIRCWPFSLDDHDIAVFRLGTLETLVVDLKTRQWAEWRSPGRTNWRAHIGCNWVGMTETLADGGTDVVAGDDETGVLWRLDPAYGRDDNTDTGSQAFSRKVTGRIPLDGRETLSCGALTLAMALGAPAQTGATISLLTSDDGGQSWLNHGAKIIAAADFKAVVEWRGLGLARAAGRLFSIEDDGATVRIGRADLR